MKNKLGLVGLILAVSAAVILVWQQPTDREPTLTPNVWKEQECSEQELAAQ